MPSASSRSERQMRHAARATGVELSCTWPAACHNSFAAVDAIANEPADAPLLRPHAFKNRSLRGPAPSTTQFTRRVMSRGLGPPAVRRWQQIVDGVAGRRIRRVRPHRRPGGTAVAPVRADRLHGRARRAVCHAASLGAPRATLRVPSDRLAAEWVPPPPLKLFASASDH